MNTTTSRPVVFAVIDPHSRQVTDLREFPAGTPVRVTRRNIDTGKAVVSIPGTLFEQTVFEANTLNMPPLGPLGTLHPYTA